MFRAPYPAHWPHLRYILDDLRYSDAQLARLLDLKPPAIKKYRRGGQAPRAVHLALFLGVTMGNFYHRRHRFQSCSGQLRTSRISESQKRQAYQANLDHGKGACEA